MLITVIFNTMDYVITLRFTNRFTGLLQGNFLVMKLQYFEFNLFKRTVFMHLPWSFFENVNL